MGQATQLMIPHRPLTAAWSLRVATTMTSAVVSTPMEKISWIIISTVKKCSHKVRLTEWMLLCFSTPGLTCGVRKNLIATGCADVTSTAGNISKETSVKVYPNPASDVIHFKLGNFNAQLSVFNILGELVDFQTIQKSDFQLDLGNYSRGLYFYSVLIDGKMVQGEFCSSVENEI